METKVQQRILSDTYNCPIEATIDLIDGKWKVIILYHLCVDGTKRFSELRKIAPGVTQKMLTAQLRDLEADGLVSRKTYAVVPPKVEYSATPLAMSLAPILIAMKDWGDDYSESVRSAATG